MADKFDNEAAKELVAQTAGKAYDDIIAPSAKPLGTVLSLLPRTIRLWFSKWEKWVLNGERSLELTAQAIKEKTEKIPLEKLTEPEPYVAIPAMQQLSYSYDSEELREMYANLLVASMNIDTKYFVHPAYVDIIKQLSPDEAKLLKYLAKNPNQPLIDVLLDSPKGGYTTQIHNFTNIGEGVCENPGEIFSYLDNLERLKLIEIPFGVYINSDNIYKPLEEHKEIRALLNSKVPNGYKFRIERHKFTLSAFGKNLIKICLP